MATAITKWPYQVAPHYQVVAPHYQVASTLMVLCNDETTVMVLMG